MNDDNNIIF